MSIITSSPGILQDHVTEIAFRAMDAQLHVLKMHSIILNITLSHSPLGHPMHDAAGRVEVSHDRPTTTVCFAYVGVGQ